VSDKAKILRTLFLSTFKLSACTFGGGYVIVPLMRKKFVEELHWIGEPEMLDLVAIAQSSPGPIAVNASILVGYHMAGVPGALITMLGTVLPPLGIISVISNILPKETAEICSRFFRGDVAGAAELQLRLLPLMNQLMIETNPIPAKAACAALGYGENLVRLPLVTMEEGNRQKLLTLMREAGLEVRA
jgi:uncharacterized protein YqcC (DUF446 family)